MKHCKLGNYSFYRIYEFPYLSGGEIICVLHDGQVTNRNSPGKWSQPKFCLPPNEGAELLSNLIESGERYREQVRDIMRILDAAHLTLVEKMLPEGVKLD